MKQESILLFGTTGQVGSALKHHLDGRFKLTVVGREHADFSNPESLRPLIQQHRPQLIINAAAYTQVDQAELEPETAIRVNAVAPTVIAEEAKAVGAALIHYSTDYVFDGSGDKPRTETDPVGPLNFYGKSKLLGEQGIQSINPAHLILRTSWVFAPSGKNFVRTILRLAKQKPLLRIVDDQIGAPTSADVIADITTKIIEQGQGNLACFIREKGGIVHLSCQGETSWYTFACTIIEFAREHEFKLLIEDIEAIPTAGYPTPARRPLNSRLDCTRLEREFALVTPSWDEALEASFPEEASL